MGIPKLLQNLLTTTASTNNVQTWNIQQAKNGVVICKITFAPAMEPANHDNSTPECEPPTHELYRSYRLKPPCQVRRDYQRSQAWRDKHHESTRGSTPIKPEPQVNLTADHESGTVAEKGNTQTSGIVTRSMTKQLDSITSDVEQLRSQVSVGDSVLNPEAEPYTLNSVVGSLSHVTDESSLMSDMTTSGDETLANESASSGESASHGPSCSNPQCTWAGLPQGEVDNSPVFECTTCKGIYICTSCILYGRHKRHKSHLKEMDT